MNRKMALGLFLAAMGLICVLCCRLLLVTTYVFPGDPVLVTPLSEAIEPTQALPGQIEPETPIEAVTVYIICEECINADESMDSLVLLVLWETPDQIGNHRPSVEHGDRCMLLDEAVSSEGIAKSLLRCQYGDGWLRTDALSSAPPE